MPFPHLPFPWYFLSPLCHEASSDNPNHMIAPPWSSQNPMATPHSRALIKSHLLLQGLALLFVGSQDSMSSSGILPLVTGHPQLGPAQKLQTLQWRFSRRSSWSGGCNSLFYR